MEVKHYHRSPRISRSMLMDTVSGRISGDSASGDAFIEIADVATHQKATNNNNIDGHIAGSESDQAMLTVTSLESYQSKDSSVLERYGSENSSNASSNASLHRRRKCRFIKKSGHCNVSHAHLQDKPKRYIADIFTTCVDLRWRWNLLLFSAAFIISWLFFGFIYWIIAYAHGDLEELEMNRPNRSCIGNLDPTTSFISAFLFSLETQTTIGYGFRVVTEECPSAILMVVVQSIFGCVIDAFMIGLIMAKISRPKKRAETLLFSKKAVISVRDGQMCLMVRVGNLRKSHLVEATIRMQYLYSRTTLEGEYIPLEQIDLHLDLKNDSDRLFLVTPQTICHPIDADSPLYQMNKNSLRNSDFEIIVILEGMVEATGMTTQARASYLPGEIEWGHRFENVITFNQSNGYHVNFKSFDNTYLTADAPICSAEDFVQRKMVSVNGQSDSLKRRNTSGSVKIIREDSSVSEGRDSGYTPVEEEEDHPTNSARTLDQQVPNGREQRNSPNTDAKRRNRMTNRQKETDRRRKSSDETSGDSLFLTTEDMNLTKKKRRSTEITSQVTQEQNLKNAAMNAVAHQETPPIVTSSRPFSAKMAAAAPKTETVVEPKENGSAKSNTAFEQQETEEKLMAIDDSKVPSSDENLSLIKNRSPEIRVPIVPVIEMAPKASLDDESSV